MTADIPSRPLLEVRELCVDYSGERKPGRRPTAFRAVDEVSFTVAAGTTLGLVGESGCGKSTTAKAVMRLIEPAAGTVEFDGEDVSHHSRKELRTLRRRIQIVLQDPYASLNPTMTVNQLIAEPLHIHGLWDSAGPDRVRELLSLVQLLPEHATRYPRQFSGGQRQRIAIARALALSPALLVLDEPVSALDVSVQAQILNLLADLQKQLGVAYLFISHDLSVIRQVCNEVAVMYLGRIVERGSVEDIFTAPQHPYTEALLKSAPVPDPTQRRGKRFVLAGEIPNPADPPSGCRFRTRCPRAVALCSEESPSFIQGRTVVACHFPLDPPSPVQ